MVARRMADERLLAVITSNSSHSVQKSCCVIATSSSTIRTFGFIFFVPVINQERTSDVFDLHTSITLPADVRGLRPSTHSPVATRVPATARRRKGRFGGESHGGNCRVKSLVLTGVDRTAASVCTTVNRAAETEGKRREGDRG